MVENRTTDACNVEAVPDERVINPTVLLEVVREDNTRLLPDMVLGVAMLVTDIEEVVPRMVKVIVDAVKEDNVNELAVAVDAVSEEASI